MFINILLSVIDNLKIGTPAHLVLRPLAVEPLKSLLATDGIALHDSLQTDVDGRCDDDDAVNIAVGSRLVHDAALEPMEAALLEVGKDGGVDDGVNGMRILFRGGEARSIIRILDTFIRFLSIVRFV